MRQEIGTKKTYSLEHFPIQAGQKGVPAQELKSPSSEWRQIHGPSIHGPVTMFPSPEAFVDLSEIGGPDLLFFGGRSIGTAKEHQTGIKYVDLLSGTKAQSRGRG